MHRLRDSPHTPNRYLNRSNPTNNGTNNDHKPPRMSNLHQVTMPQTPEASSPISPSVHVPGSTSSTTTRSSRMTSRLLQSPAPFYGPSFSVSSLGFESGFLPDQPDVSSSSSSSSSEDEVDQYQNNPYDSDRSTSSSSRFLERRAPAIRKLHTSSRALKPKVKSFLRISKELQDEQSPMDHEIKREAEITHLLREEDGEDDHDSGKASVSTETIESPTTAAHPKTMDDMYRYRSMWQSDTDDSDVNSAAAASAAGPQKPLKRKAASLIEDESVSNLKRRAVSPGLSSPVLGGTSPVPGSGSTSSTSSKSTKRSGTKHVQDASEGFENMSLK